MQQRRDSLRLVPAIFQYQRAYRHQVADVGRACTLARLGAVNLVGKLEREGKLAAAFPSSSAWQSP